MLLASSFLLAGNIIEGFYNDVADDLLQHFEKTCIARYLRNAPRHPPLFVVNLWNMFNRTDDELSRTSNSVIEVFKATYLHVILCFGYFHPFYEKKKTEFVFLLPSTLRDLHHHHQGNRRILRIMDNYPNWQRLQYLRVQNFSTLLITQLLKNSQR